MTARMRLVDAARPKKIKKDNCHRTNHARAVQMRARTCYGSLLHDMKIQLSITPLICAALDARCRSGSLRARRAGGRRGRSAVGCLRMQCGAGVVLQFCADFQICSAQWRKDAASHAASLLRNLSWNGRNTLLVAIKRPSHAFRKRLIAFKRP
jgi:hypothetical protein